VNGMPAAFAAAQDQLGAEAPGADAAGGGDGEGRFAAIRIFRFSRKRRDIDQHPRQESHPLEGAAVVAQRDLVLGAAVEEVEDRPRRRRFAISRRSSILTASAKCIIAGDSTR